MKEIIGAILGTGWVTFVLGLVVGSFLNVCIHRIPRGVSLVRPGSACPVCHTPVKWYDNVPVISYLVLRGRCRACHGSISWQYPVVELTTGFLFWLSGLLAGSETVLLYYWAWVSLLLVVTMVDFRHQIIPDVITIPGILLALTVRTLGRGSLLDGLLGALVGGGSLFLVGWIYQRMTKVEGMGGGDIKLMAMVGAGLGWKGSLAVIFLGATAGAVTGLALMAAHRAGRRTALPFGSFLAPVAVGVLLAGSHLSAWYQGVVG